MPHEKSQTEVTLTKDGAVATVRFASAAGVNIFSSRVIGALGTIIEKLAEDPHVRFVVFRGDGRVFLAGADISEMQAFTEHEGSTFAQRGHRVFDAIEALPQPTFAALNGHALGGGCELALACDFRIAVPDAKIGLPETRLGLIPGWGGTQRLPRYVGLGMARKLVFSGVPLPAADALRIGLVDEIVPAAAELDAALKRWFEALAAASPAAIRRSKQAMRTGEEITEFANCFCCSDAKEGIAAFIEKRQPAWTDWACGH